MRWSSVALPAGEQVARVTSRSLSGWCLDNPANCIYTRIAVYIQSNGHRNEHQDQQIHHVPDSLSDWELQLLEELAEELTREYHWGTKAEAIHTAIIELAVQRGIIRSRNSRWIVPKDQRQVAEGT